MFFKSMDPNSKKEGAVSKVTTIFCDKCKQTIVATGWSDEALVRWNRNQIPFNKRNDNS